MRMDVAKRVLEKYGWSEGQGLGKNLDGIRAPIKTKKKLDKAGIGHSLSKTFTDHWWEKAFNRAVSNITVQTTEMGVKMEAVDGEASNKLPYQGNLCHPQKFNQCGFLKRETLENGQLVKSDNPERQAVTSVPLVALTDEQLFQACGGRTAHKAARHGLKLTGKLKRLQEQEQTLLAVEVNGVHTGAVPQRAFGTADTIAIKSVNEGSSSTYNPKRKCKKDRKQNEGVSNIFCVRNLDSHEILQGGHTKDTKECKRVSSHCKRRKREQDVSCPLKVSFS